MFQFTRNKDDFAKIISGIFATASISIVVLIIFFLLKESTQAVSSVGLLSFFKDSSWLPEPEAKDGSFGVISLVIGTCVVSLLALLIATPLGILSSICIVFYCNKRVSKLCKLLVELLAGIPSVVFGLWGLIFLVPIMQHISKTGLSVLTGSLVLSLMIVPTIILSAIHTLKSAEVETKESSLALGISKQSNIIKIILPIASSGLGIGLLLALTRAIGETMVVVMLCGNIAQIPHSVTQPVRTLTANIALEMAYAYGDHRSALFFTGFLLMILVSILLLSLEGIKNR